MTTDAQSPQDGEWIPRYFSDFRKEFDAFKEENARQHVELAGRISGLEVHIAERISSLETHFAQVETRIAQMEARLMWRGLGGLALIASLAVAAMRLLPA